MLVISNQPRACPILQLLAQLLPELYSTWSNYYYINIIIIMITITTIITVIIIIIIFIIIQLEVSVIS